MKTHHPLVVDLGRFLGVATVPQLADHYCGGDTERLRSVLRPAQASGWVKIHRALIRKWKNNGRPLDIVQPGGGIRYTAGQISYQAIHRRWSSDFILTTVVAASQKLTSFYGGEQRPSTAAALSHDLALTELFLSVKRAQDPSFTWTLIASMPGNGAMPDAIAAGGVAIELIGQYGSTSVSAKLAIAGSITLELW